MFILLSYYCYILVASISLSWESFGIKTVAVKHSWMVRRCWSSTQLICRAFWSSFQAYLDGRVFIQRLALTWIATVRTIRNAIVFCNKECDVQRAIECTRVNVWSWLQAMIKCFNFSIHRWIQFLFRRCV
jgi:hypothetical protein